MPPSPATPAQTRPKTGFDISRILKYAPAELIGREEETKLLDDAWDKVQKQTPGRPKILTFVALGGEGKTALVAKWAAELAAQDWPGCDAAFAWSFYSQGTREQQAASSDLFLKEALSFFGDDADRAFAASPAGAFEKGQRLARILGQKRSLLILDGLEPLQYAPTAPTPGELKDQGLAALLKGLAAASQGLCLVTTRYSLPDLRAFWLAPPSPSGRGAGGEGTAPEVQLRRLSRAAGVHLLKSLGVRGTTREFETLVEDVKGHALTLHILGGFLRRAFGGDIRQRNRVKFEKADAKIDGGHAFRAMAAYAQWMEDGSDEARRELAILRILGLFDRPATRDCLAALLQPPAIAGLTDPLVGLGEEDWNLSLDALTSANLVSAQSDDASPIRHSSFAIRHSLDTHPHIREYFAKQVREKNPDAWRAAHRRLYEHLCATAPECTRVDPIKQMMRQLGMSTGAEGDQPRLEDLQPLYQAVAHGCQAGLQQETAEGLYLNRITRGNEKYPMRKLGAFGSDLGAVACFFEQPWSRVSSVLNEAYQAWMFNQAAFRLRALGRLAESLEPMRAGLPIELKREDWENAAIRASNLSELELTLGEVAGAVGDASRGVTYADRSGDAFWKLASRTAHADALHQAGRRAEAEKLFREAEQLQQERQPDYPRLYSQQGFIYCDLLLAAPERAAWQGVLNSAVIPAQAGIQDRGETLDSRLRGSEGSKETPPLLESCRSVSQRAAQIFEWRKLPKWNPAYDPLLDIALDHLTLGRAALYAAILSHAEFDTARRELDAAVAGLRRAGQVQELPRGLLSRAWLRALDGIPTGLDSAQADLDEAWEIAERGPMRLFLADIHLHRARLFFRASTYPWESPLADLAAARKLIEACGYWRRKEELEDAEAVIGRLG